MIHSEEYIEDSRFQWWNPDYLDLLIKRFALREAKSILEVGTGLGHWSRPLLKRIPTEWTFHGLDKEQHWVDKSLAAFAAEFPDVHPSRFDFGQGDAHSLPYPDESFDLVTCQTVLMHLRDPLTALQEMRRVLRIGGLILCAEPINLINRLSFSTVTNVADVETLVNAFRLWTYFQRGIRTSNNGDHNIGAYLPSLLKTAGFHSIEAYTNDKASFTFPGSYDPSECEAIWEDARVIRETALAGGATEAEISAGLNALELLQALKVKQVADDQFAQSRPSVTLVVGARR
jgi:ubiquinone/menaquinone biosynthesis C-methylase UbiE